MLFMSSFFDFLNLKAGLNFCLSRGHGIAADASIHRAGSQKVSILLTIAAVIGKDRVSHNSSWIGSAR